jgi:hypothetical protein
MSVRWSKALLVAMVLALAVGLVGCGSDSAEDATTPPAAEDSGTGTEAGDMGEPVTEDPATLTQEKCTGCHEYDRVESAKMDAAGWESTVDHMIENGLVVTADERQIIIDYLTGQDL